MSDTSRGIMREALLTLGFSVLTYLFANIRFTIPVFGSMTSGFNEVGVLISTLHVRHWSQTAIVGLVAGVQAPDDVRWLSMGAHAFAGGVAWFFQRWLASTFTDFRKSAPLWVAFVVAYYYLLLTPIFAAYTMIVVELDPGHFSSGIVLALIPELAATAFLTTSYHAAFVEIARRIRTEQRLSASEGRYRLVAELTDKLIYDLDVETGKITWAGRIDAITGYTMEEFQAVDLKRWEEMIHPDDQAEATTLLDACMKTGSRYRVEYRFRTKDGGYVYMDDDGIFLRDAHGRMTRMLGTMTNIDERKRAEAALRESEQRYRELYTKTPVMMHSVDREGRILAASQRWLEVMGYSEWEILGRRSIDFLTPESREHAVNVVLPDFYRTKQTSHVEYRMVKKNGEVIDVLLSAIAELDGDGRISKSLAVITDVTERKKLEQGLIRAQKTESLGRVAGGIAHDMNNMLAVILPTAEMLLDAASDPAQVRKFGEVIRVAAKRAADIVKQLLVFARQAPISKSPMFLNDLIRETHKLLTRLLGAQITVLLDLDKETPVIDADATQIQQILINLCVNARDAMNDSGTITIVTRVRELDAGNAHGIEPGRCAALLVEDTGCGIPKDILPHVFEPFYSTKELGKGTGLGLAVVKTIVTTHGGFVDIRSQIGKGTTFEIGFPESRRITEGKGVTDPSRASGTGTILLVDDEPDILQMGKAILERLGYRVRTAMSGPAAIEILHSHRVDLVLLDIQMPGMNGFETLKRLQRLQPDLRYVLTTGFISTDHLQVFDGHPAERVLLKPYSMEHLSLAVQRVIQS